jgi:DNA polymerase III alpha subunit (gram-positive type)
MKAQGFMKTVAWIDIETGGLDKNSCALLSLGIIITDKMNEICREEFRFRPSGSEFIQQAALDVNGFTLGDINRFPEFTDEIKRFENFIKKNIGLCELQNNKFYIGGQNNIYFDIPFIQVWLNRRQASLPTKFDFNKYFHLDNQIDTKKIAQAYGNLIWKESRPYNNQLTSMSEFYGLNTDKAHNATDDIARTIQVYIEICKDFTKNN